MREEHEVKKAYALALEMTRRLEAEEYHVDSIAPAILAKGFEWMLEKEDSEDLLQQLKEDVRDTEEEVDENEATHFEEIVMEQEEDE